MKRKMALTSQGHIVPSIVTGTMSGRGINLGQQKQYSDDRLFLKAVDMEWTLLERHFSVPRLSRYKAARKGNVQLAAFDYLQNILLAESCSTRLKSHYETACTPNWQTAMVEQTGGDTGPMMGDTSGNYPKSERRAPKSSTGRRRQLLTKFLQNCTWDSGVLFSMLGISIISGRIYVWYSHTAPNLCVNAALFPMLWGRCACCGIAYSIMNLYYGCSQS